MFEGSMVALVTPMYENGVIDFDALDKLIEFQIEQGTQAVVIAGTTGEGGSLSSSEFEKVIQAAVAQTAGRVPVIVGTGTNSTRSTIERTNLAKSLGAQAALVVAPYYNMPTQQGLYLHYKAVAESCAFPIILYNVPNRTGVDILPETVEKLAAIDHIIGIKEAVGNSDRYRELIKRAPEGFRLYSGDDRTAMSLMLAGGHGVISVTANVAPALMRAMSDAAIAKDGEQAVSLNEKLSALHENLFIEANPIPVKWALAEMDLIPVGLRLPLTKLSKQYQTVVAGAIESAGIATAEHA